MAKPTIVSATMKLYSPFAPEGRTFQRGEEWPGDAWTTKPGGESDDADALLQSQKDLIEAHDEIARLEKVLASKDHDLSVMAKQRDEATAALNAQKQALLDAQQALAEMEKVAVGLTKERDQARGHAEALNRRLAKADA